MRTVVIGAGPTGLFTAIALARRGRDLVVVDRDPGPPSDLETVWQRKGVMQFHHAHTFRGPVVDALRAELPDVLDDLVTAGATVTTADNRPLAMLCRRSTFDRALWNRAAEQRGLTLVCGHVDRIEQTPATPSVSGSTAARCPRTWSSTRRAARVGSPTESARRPRAATAVRCTSLGSIGYSTAPTRAR